MGTSSDTHRASWHEVVNSFRVHCVTEAIQLAGCFFAKGLVQVGLDATSDRPPGVPGNPHKLKCHATNLIAAW